MVGQKRGGTGTVNPAWGRHAPKPKREAQKRVHDPVNMVFLVFLAAVPLFHEYDLQRDLNLAHTLKCTMADLDFLDLRGIAWYVKLF